METIASLLKNLIAKMLDYVKIEPGEEWGNKVTITDFEAVPDEVWGRYSKAMVSFGYDFKGAEDAKMLTRRHLKNNIVALEGEHAEAFKQAIGIKDVYKPKATPKNILNKAVKIFGITENPENAGYILTDGRMLDMSETKGPGGRSLDHRSIERVMGGAWVEDMREFMNMGNIRTNCTSKTIAFDLKKRPTSDQISTMRTIIRDYPIRSTIADVFIDAAGRHKEFTDRDPKYDDVDKILNYIKESF